MRLSILLVAGILAASTAQAEEFTIQDAESWNPSERVVKARCSSYCDFAMGLEEHTYGSEKFTLAWDRSFDGRRFLSVRIDRPKRWWNSGRTYQAFYACDPSTIMAYEVTYHRNP